MRRAKSTAVEDMPDHSPAMPSRMVGKGKKSKKMMEESESECEYEMKGGRMPRGVELSGLIALGKDGQHYMLDPSALATKPRLPVPRDNVSGKGRRVLEGGVLGTPLADVKYRDTLSGSAMAGAGTTQRPTLGALMMEMGRDTIGTSTAVKGPAISGMGMDRKGLKGMGMAGAGTLSITHEGGAMKGDGRKRRAEIVKKVMKERGIKSLAEASKLVKKEGLY